MRRDFASEVVLHWLPGSIDYCLLSKEERSKRSFSRGACATLLRLLGSLDLSLNHNLFTVLDIHSLGVRLAIQLAAIEAIPGVSLIKH